MSALFGKPRTYLAITYQAILVTIVLALSAQAQTFTVLHTFENTEGANPQAALVQDNTGNLYSTTEYGGIDQAGAVFKISLTGQYTDLHQFTDYPDGARPVAPLLSDGRGDWYGTTYAGGTNCLLEFYCGTVFEIDSAGNESILYRFNGSPDGANPNAGLIHDAKGNGYGTTVFGGASGTCNYPYGCGTVFEIDREGDESVLYSFTGDHDGFEPYGSMVMDPEGRLYGTTEAGGVFNATCNMGCGTIFRLVKSGSGWTKQTLFRFSGANGAAPYANMIFDKSGNLYGTTLIGGTGTNCLYLGEKVGCGTVFKLDNSGTESMLYNFTGKSDGAEPQAGLIQDAAGNLYGTAMYGGSPACNGGLGCGTVFRLSPAGKLSVVHEFSGGSDGATPVGALLLGKSAVFGTASIGGDDTCQTQEGGGPGCGTVFEITR
jgi:uncharacterized repeat protein (TIGR03803 family)